MVHRMFDFLNLVEIKSVEKCHLVTLASNYNIKLVRNFSLTIMI